MYEFYSVFIPKYQNDNGMQRRKYLFNYLDYVN